MTNDEILQQLFEKEVSEEQPDQEIEFLDKMSPDQMSEAIKKQKNPFIREIMFRVWKKNKNVLVAVVGGTGSGKSYVALRIASEIDKTFNHEILEKRLAYKPHHFFEIVNSNLKKGQVIIVDEGGTTADAREWHSFNNRAISHILQTFRYENLIVFFCVPSMAYLDIAARRLMHYYIEAIDIDAERNQNIVKILKLQHNPAIDKTYTKHFRIKMGHRVKRIHRWRIKKVRARLWHKYESLSQLQKLHIKQELAVKIEAIKKQDEKDQTPRIPIQSIVSEILKDPAPFTKTNKPLKVPISVIEAHFDVPFWYASKAKVLVERELKKRADEKGGSDQNENE